MDVNEVIDSFGLIDTQDSFPSETTFPRRLHDKFPK